MRPPAAGYAAGPPKTLPGEGPSAAHRTAAIFGLRKSTALIVVLQYDRKQDYIRYC